MKRFKKHSDLIRQAVKNIGRRDVDELTAEELHAKYILVLAGMRHPSIELIREAMKNVQCTDE